MRILAYQYDGSKDDEALDSAAGLFLEHGCNQYTSWKLLCQPVSNTSSEVSASLDGKVYTTVNSNKY